MQTNISVAKYLSQWKSDEQTGSPIITIDCHSGAYGPTILIYSDLRDDLIALREVFDRLASRECDEVCLGAALEAGTSGLKDLQLFASDENPSGAVRRIDQAGDLALLRWECVPDDWKWCASLVDALVESGASAHQYLTTQGVGDALVQVEFKPTSSYAPR